MGEKTELNRLLLLRDQQTPAWPNFRKWLHSYETLEEIMSVADQKQFTDAVARAKAGFWGGTIHMLTDDWKAALNACNRLAMPDMLAALSAIDSDDRRLLLTGAGRNPRAVLPTRIVPSDDRKGVIGEGGVARILFATDVIEFREIEDHGLPDEQVNDGREFLGCTRMDDGGVRTIINDALTQAKAAGATGCCGAIHNAWFPILVGKRRAAPNASLISNLAAAAHYMLARYHVCSALAIQWQMKTVIDGYDSKKRVLIGTGDREMKGIAITGNPAFPPDFGIRAWAYKGADDGETDRLKCNSKATRPPLPIVDGQEL
jgi:hypothetical protein